MNQKLSTKYDFYCLKVSHQVLIEKTLKTNPKTDNILHYYLVFQSLVNYNLKADLQTIKIIFYEQFWIPGYPLHPWGCVPSA